MTKKIRVGILFGGKSAEHEVSLLSAQNVMDAIDKKRFEIVAIAIQKNGSWVLPRSGDFLLNRGDAKKITLNQQATSPVALLPEKHGALSEGSGTAGTVDVVFPILHGPFGEDGTVQGLLKLAGIPFVGASVLGSAVGMDKDVMKRLLRDAKIPIAKFVTILRGEKIDTKAIVKKLGLPLFVKPANLGSSVGVHKVKKSSDLATAIEDAFRYDTKILVEEFVDAREIECAVLGNRAPIASGIGEIIPSHEFYSYDAKYLDPEGARLEIPAKIPKTVAREAQKLALATFKALSCEGLGRVDMFLTKRGRLLVNEINTMPGFTQISMYPKLWAEAGISYSDLITRLIELAIERFETEKKLQTNR
jgi:D-alanine-D-alanine ligase